MLGGTGRTIASVEGVCGSVMGIVHLGVEGSGGSK